MIIAEEHPETRSVLGKLKYMVILLNRISENVYICHMDSQGDQVRQGE